MTEFKGTPGPWFTDSDGIIRQTPPIATGYYSPIPLASAFIETAWQGVDQTEESYANAKMAAAAPDLLKVLEAIVSETTVGKKGSCVTRSKYVSYSAARYHEARAAIAKALGQ